MFGVLVRACSTIITLASADIIFRDYLVDDVDRAYSGTRLAVLDFILLESIRMQRTYDP